MPIPLRGDRSAHDDIDYPELHARDLDNSTPIHHLPSAQYGQVPEWDGAKWVASSVSAVRHSHNYIALVTTSGSASFYDGDTAGLADVLAIAESTDTVLVPPGNYIANYTLPTGVNIIFDGLEAKIYGKLTLNHECKIENGSVYNITSGSDPVVAVEIAATGHILIERMAIRAQNLGTGNAYAISTLGGSFEGEQVWICAQADNAGANARCIHSAGSVSGCRLEYSTFKSSTNIDAAADANWELTQTVVPYLSSCIWHPGYDPGATVSLETGDRAKYNHTHTSGSGGASSFLELTDTPSSYTDQGGKFVRVNEGETALEFATSSVTDSAAIHDDTSGEIHAITEKASPVGDDELIIEDSAASYAKKRIKISALPSSGSPGGSGGADILEVQVFS